MMVRKAALMLAVGVTLLSGCYSLQTAFTDDMIAWRNYRAAQSAWWSCRDVYVDCEPNLYDFGLGFRAGYINVASGGNGCPPTLPPQRYWGPYYQSDCGREQVVAWYNGYAHGVELATADGMGNSNQIVTSMELYPQCRTATQIELPNPHEVGTAPVDPQYGEGLVPPRAPQLNPAPADLY